jgi:hypothetical protein
VRFVSLAAYEAAGGYVRRDLFSDDENAGYIADAELLQKLVAQKLDATAAEVQAEGWGWGWGCPRLAKSKRFQTAGSGNNPFFKCVARYVARGLFLLPYRRQSPIKQGTLTGKPNSTTLFQNSY